jgi:hypothetical protein
MNVVIDSRGAIRRRPGISTYSGAPSTVIDGEGIHGLHATQDGNLPGKLYAVAAPQVSRPFYLLAAGGATDLSLVPMGWLAGSSRPIFAETEQLLVIATGAELQKIDRDTNLSERLGGDPPLASHVVANSSRLLANDVDLDREHQRDLRVRLEHAASVRA